MRLSGGREGPADRRGWRIAAIADIKWAVLKTNGEISFIKQQSAGWERAADRAHPTAGNL
jgi:uncharacterized membrane protein YcaP (DUF421 family)